MASFTSYSGLGNMPCNGGTAIITENWLFPISYPPPDIMNMASFGSTTTIKSLVKRDDNAVVVDGSITNSGQWNQSGNGYQVTLTRSATDANARRMSCADARYIPAATGFTCCVLIKCPSTFNALTSIFAKIHSAFTETRGFGVRINAGATAIDGWVDNPATAGKTASLPIASLVASEYALVWLRYDTAAGGTLTLHIDSSAGSNETTTTSVGATTLGLSAASYSDFYGGATPASAAGYGLLVFGGQFVWSAMWSSAAVSDSLFDDVAADPFMLTTFPRGIPITLECPQSMPVGAGAGAVERTKFICTIGTSFDKDQGHTLVVAFQGTASNTFTRQGWADMIQGAAAFPLIVESNAGLTNDSNVYLANTDGGPGWPELCNSTTKPLAVFHALDYYNGGANGLGGGSETNNSMLRRRTLQIYDYFDGILNNPLPTDDRTKIIVTGWSAGASFAWAFVMWRPDKCGRACICHSTLGTGGVIANFDQYITVLGNRDRDYTTPATGSLSTELPSCTSPATELTAYANGQSRNWRTDTLAKSIPVLIITGQGAADFPSGDKTEVEKDIAVAQSQGYYLWRHKTYTTTRSAGHVHDRDKVVLFDLAGFGPFFSGTTSVKAMVNRRRRAQRIIVR